MAMEFIPKALYPLVPNAPGVPALLRNGVKVLDTLTLGVFGLSGALDSLIGAEPVQWGIFSMKTGRPVAMADSVVSLDYRNAARISDYPVEQGAFASYNKVDNPYDIKVRMTCGGSQARRGEFIAAIEAASRSLELYLVLTPERSFSNANIEAWDCRREAANGAGIIIADLHMREVRQTATAAFNAPKTPAAADPLSQGQGQTFPVTQSVINAIELPPSLTGINDRYISKTIK